MIFWICFFFERKRLFVGHAEVKFQFFRLSVVLTMKIFVYFDLTDFTIQNNNETKNINKSPITRFTPRYLNQSLNVFFYSPYISTHILHRRRIVRLLPSFFASPYALIRLHQKLHALKKTGFFMCIPQQKLVAPYEKSYSAFIFRCVRSVSIENNSIFVLLFALSRSLFLHTHSTHYTHFHSNLIQFTI